MVIKNILFLLVASLGFIACQTGPQTAPAPTHPEVQGPARVPEVTSAPGTAETVKVPEFVAQRAPRVGLIFGPGGAKAIAHVGVMQEIEKYKIPVVAVAGLEWGAVVGALYSIHGQSHEVDWKISQLPPFSFTGRNLFSQKAGPTSTKDYDQYLQKVFLNTKLEEGKIPFTCPYVRGPSGRVTLVTKGAIKNSLRPCWYYPPLFERSENIAAPFSLTESVAYLKQQGAELIILVNVLESVDKKEFASWADGDWSWFAWVPVQSTLKGAKMMGVHEVISIDTSAYTMTDLDQRLRLIQLGKQGAAGQLDKLVKKYDF